MDLKIIAYKIFSSNNEFVAWQREYKKPVVSVMPFVLNLNATLDNTLNASTSVGCFITYIEEGYE